MSGTKKSDLGNINFEKPSNNRSSDDNKELLVKVQFFEATHGVKSYQNYNVALNRDKPNDPYSHAITRHSPDSEYYENKDNFESYSEVHQVRKEYLEHHAEKMAILSESGIKVGVSYGFKKKFISSNGKEYAFTFRWDGEKWQEITGYPLR